MKNLVTTAACLLMMFTCSRTAFAQTSPAESKTANEKGIILSAGIEAGLPNGKLSDGYDWNIGGSLQADIPVAHDFFFVANLGYNSFQAKDNGYGMNAPATDIQLLPVKAGLKYFPLDGIYLQVDAGAAFSLNKTENNFTNETAFIYAPQIGTQFSIGGKNYIDAGIRYERSTKFISGNDNSLVSFFGLRLAYGFGL